MQIREATIDDAESIKKVYLQAFDNSEAEVVSELALKLLENNRSDKILSLVAIENREVAGHVSFSPVYFDGTDEHFGFILSPLAVSPGFQKNNIGASLVKYGLDYLSKMGSFIVFVYGDPEYYSRFDFETGLANNYIPPFSLQFPEGWQALRLNSAKLPEGGKIVCVDSFNNPNLW